ncbi:hypothetical protein FHS18_005714 [Paenibacillus phyllosphaerae]|uniref:SWIM-type domain-containing protein n=1 Tax=Paenibacillus phyllosphaerae TaxID=274593 RepID=A0A7W5B4M7_9BACL|nr:SWIM zinc finger family protein [Paenibacillus phyllosphaerae]MBB3113601.1 hypothetical protein [Paenibacillus phyllosphaerae]
MHTRFRLDDGLDEKLESQLAEVMPAEMQERGWDYYRREKVRAVEVMNGTSIYGSVNGTKVYAVTIDAEEITFSTCTCPYNGYCKHMAAVYFAYCNYVGDSPDEAYNRLLYGGQGLVKLDAADAQPKAGLEAQGQGLAVTPAEWFEDMERRYGDTWRQCRHSLHPLQSVLTALKGQSKAWPDRLKKLHWMHAVLFVADQAERAYSATDSYSRYYYEMAFARMTEPWINQYTELGGETLEAGLTGAEREAIQSLASFFHRREMDREQQLHRWETLYFSLLGRLVDDVQWRGEEERWLSDEFEQMKQAGKRPSFYPMALAFLAFVDGEDTRAVHLLTDTEFNRTALLACDCALDRLEDAKWEKLEIWMDYIYGGLQFERKSRAFGPFLSMCRIADERQPDNPVWEKHLIAFLPFSYSALSDHWIEQQRYEQWADLQMYIGIDPDELDLQAVREITKSAPHVLIPMYHQAIDTGIRSRNRQGYRNAVKQMKKLEKLYKAEKKQEAWNRFVNEIAHRHQRLRALQEELWRGKIIT